MFRNWFTVFWPLLRFLYRYQEIRNHKGELVTIIGYPFWWDPPELLDGAYLKASSYYDFKFKRK